jgi:hypothetical protein
MAEVGIRPGEQYSRRAEAGGLLALDSDNIFAISVDFTAPQHHRGGIAPTLAPKPSTAFRSEWQEETDLFGRVGRACPRGDRDEPPRLGPR